MIKSVDIPVDLLSTMNDVSKLLKTDHVLFDNCNGNGIYAIGLKSSMSGYASISTIKFDSDALLYGVSLPFPMGMQSSTLSSICKAISDDGNKINFVKAYADFVCGTEYMPKSLYSAYGDIPLYNTYDMQLQKVLLLQALSSSTMECNILLSGDPVFEKIMQLKADAGMQFMNIGKYPVSISHFLVNCNKGDVVYATVLHLLNDEPHRLIEIIVTKPKKHCTITTFIKVLVL